MLGHRAGVNKGHLRPSEWYPEQCVVPYADLHVHCMCIVYMAGRTVESLLKDTLNKGHHRNYLPTKDSLKRQNRLSYSVNACIYIHLKSGQPLYSGQVSWTQYVLCEEFPLCICVHIDSEFSMAVWLCSVMAHTYVRT